MAIISHMVIQTPCISIQTHLIPLPQITISHLTTATAAGIPALIVAEVTVEEVMAAAEMVAVAGNKFNIVSILHLP